MENETINYLYAVFFVLNIATTTGFPSQIVYNDLERICFIAVIYIGDAIFSIAFGMMASNSDIFMYKFPQNSENRIKIEKLLSQSPGHYNQVKKKLKKYFAYALELKTQNISYLESLRNLLPEQIVIKMFIIMLIFKIFISFLI